MRPVPALCSSCAPGLLIAIMTFDRIVIVAASSGLSSRASHTLAKVLVFLSGMKPAYITIDIKPQVRSNPIALRPVTCRELYNQTLAEYQFNPLVMDRRPCCRLPQKTGFQQACSTDPCCIAGLLPPRL